MWSKSPSYQSRASRNARQCQSVFRFAPHRLPQTRRAESLRFTPLPVYVGPRRSGQSLPQFRLRSFPPSLPSPSVSSSLPAPTCSASTSGRDCPPPARLTRAKVNATVLLFDCMCKLPYTVLPRFCRIKTVACRGLRPCPLCHLCPATATAIAVAASGPKQHRPSDERPLRPQCELQRHHQPEGSCRGYIYLFIGSSRACARLLYLSSMASERHTQTDDLAHLEASRKAVIIVLKTE